MNDGDVTVTQVEVTLSVPGLTAEVVGSVMDEMSDVAVLQHDLLDWAVSAVEADGVLEFELIYSIEDVVEAEDRAMGAVEIVMVAATQGQPSTVTKRTGDLVCA